MTCSTRWRSTKPRSVTLWAIDLPVRLTSSSASASWASVSKFPVDAAFPLSDHADFRDTMRYIYESGAKRVICANSNSLQAAGYLCSIGIDAMAKSEMGKEVQTTLVQC